jgi:hypothetical protein
VMFTYIPKVHEKVQKLFEKKVAKHYM